MKVCRVCGIEKDSNDFPARGGRVCKKCKCASAKEYRLKNIGRVREYDRNRPNKEERKRKQKERLLRLKVEDHERFADLTYRRGNRWRKEHNQRQKAWGALNDAIRYGKLERPTVCSRCGSEGDIEAHHEDYSKPLDVMWLCVRCHNELHKEKNKKKRESSQQALEGI